MARVKHSACTGHSLRILINFNKFALFSLTEEGRFEVTEDVTAQGLRHTLMVHKAQAKDFGPYNCSVQNAYGSDVFEIILNKKSELLLLAVLSCTAIQHKRYNPDD